MMSTAAETVLTQALGLSAEERLSLATRLLESVEGPDEAWDTAWVRELQRREAEPEVEAGEAVVAVRSALKSS